jgi:hypothetical protein
VTLGWRRSPKTLGYGALWLLGAYAFGYVTEHSRMIIINFVLANPIFDSELFQMRLLTAMFIAAGAPLAFHLGRRYWRGAVGTPIAALALVSIVASARRSCSSWRFGGRAGPASSRFSG